MEGDQIVPTSIQEERENEMHVEVNPAIIGDDENIMHGDDHVPSLNLEEPREAMQEDQLVPAPVPFQHAAGNQFTRIPTLAELVRTFLDQLTRTVVQSATGDQTVPSGTEFQSATGDQIVPSGPGFLSATGDQIVPSGPGFLSATGDQIVPSGAGFLSATGDQIVPSGPGFQSETVNQTLPSGPGFQSETGNQTLPSRTEFQSETGNQIVPTSTVEGREYRIRHFASNIFAGDLENRIQGISEFNLVVDRDSRNQEFPELISDADGNLNITQMEFASGLGADENQNITQMEFASVLDENENTLQNEPVIGLIVEDDENMMQEDLIPSPVSAQHGSPAAEHGNTTDEEFFIDDPDFEVQNRMEGDQIVPNQNSDDYEFQM